jgi:hypothetical protein
MGLDTSHGAWHGAYSAFMAWRLKIAEVAGYPPLELMEGFYSPNNHSDPFVLLEYKFPKGDELEMSALRRFKKQLPIKWQNFEENPLIYLLTHSDCDGDLSYGKCKGIADELEKLLPLLPDEDAGGHIGNWRLKTQTFIDGLRLAHSKKEKLKFH